MAGRKELVITEEQKKQVETMAGYGMTQEQIASVMKICVNSLTKHCGDELKRGKDLGYVTAMNSLMKNIRQGKERSITWYMAVIHGLTEKQEIEHNINKIAVINFGKKPEQE